MKNATVEDVIAIFPHPNLPVVQGDPDYHTIHSIHILIGTNARSIETHLGYGAIYHLGVIVLIPAYAIVTPEDPWKNP
jgi:hypothetical protein